MINQNCFPLVSLLKLMVLLSVLYVKLFVLPILSLLNIPKILLYTIVLILTMRLVMSSNLMSHPCSFAAPLTLLIGPSNTLPPNGGFFSFQGDSYASQ